MFTRAASIIRGVHIQVITVLIACLAITIFTPDTVKAAAYTPKMQQLKRGITYTNYDVTGDRKPDVFSYRPGETGYTNFYINKKYVGRTWTARGSLVYWARLASGKTYLIVNYSLYNGTGNTVLQYKSGKFKAVSGEAVSKYNYLYSEPSRVAGYSIFFTGSPRNMPYEFVPSENKVTGTSQFRLNNGAFKLVSRYLEVGGNTVHKIKKGFYTSTNNRTKNTSGMYVPAGATVKILKIFKSSDPTYAGGTWYQLQYGSRTGWFYAW